MPKPVKSAKGVDVNFDLLRIKQQISAAPPTADVRARENFIDAKFKRRLKKAQRAVAQVFPPVTVEQPLPTPEAPLEPESKEPQ